MDQSLEREIRRLYSCFHSPGDRQGRSFVPLADAYRRAGDLLRARLLLEEGLRRHPGFSSAHVVAMRIARDVSDHAATLAATRRVLELDPDNAEARQVLARVGPLARDAGSPAASGPGGDGDAELPDESWMVGDAGVWAAGTDSGLASVDPVALEAEEEQAALAEVEKEPPAGVEVEEEQMAMADAGEEPPATVQAERDQHAAREAQVEEAASETEGRAAPVSKRRARSSTHSTGIPIAIPAEASDAVRDAGIYTRTMGRLYEQQGLHAQAIAVYERLIESEPDDEALVSRLERLRRQPRDEASGSAPGQREPRGVSSGTESSRPGAPPDDERPGTAGDESVNATTEPEAAPGGVAATTRGVDPEPGGELPVVPIESLAPDAPFAGAREEAP